MGIKTNYLVWGKTPQKERLELLYSGECVTTAEAVAKALSMLLEVDIKSIVNQNKMKDKNIVLIETSCYWEQ